MDLDELKSFKLSDAVKFHEDLNPKLFKDMKMIPTVRKQLLLIADDFLAELGISNLNVKDITVSGSNAAYSYTPNSDLDLHLIVDMKQFANNEVYKELFNAKKTVYNDTHDITVKNISVELYVQDSEQPHTSLGEYSVLNDEWVKFPTKRKANLDQTATKVKYEQLKELIELAVKTKDLERIKKVLDIIKRYRKAGLQKGGEFGPENLSFKILRSQGMIQQLFDLKKKLHSRELSIEDYDPNGPPPGPEFKPTMPAGTVRVDVSDVYDWYKLGQHISNMKGLGKHDFGKGPPSTVLSFGDEDTEHKYIQDLEKTGLTTTDIDPIDPKQPKGMKRQKTDPTYNVNEAPQSENKIDDLSLLSKAADEQRGLPEILMVKAQHVLGGGVLPFCIEHVGDIYNRMYNTGYGALDDPYAIEERRQVVLDKIAKTLRVLTQKYGFEREHEENIKSNASAMKKNVAQFKQEITTALNNYAEAHSKLPIYNKVQKLARAASIALGKQNFNSAALYLFSLQDIARDKEKWNQEINKIEKQELAETSNETIRIPAGPKTKVTHEAPRYLYHSLRGRKLSSDGSIRGYPLAKREAELEREFDQPGSDGYVWLSPYPYTEEALKIDAAKLNPHDLRYTGQVEGFLIHKGNIPAKAIISEISESIKFIEGTNCKNCVWWKKDSEKPIGKDELNKYGGLKPPNKEYIAMSKRVDLVTLPGKDTVKVKGFCYHKDINDWVTERMCCAKWDGKGVLRDYKGQSPLMELLDTKPNKAKVNSKTKRTVNESLGTKIDAHRVGDTIWINYFEVPVKGKGLGRKEYEKFEKSLPKDIKQIRLVASDAGYGPTHDFWDKMGFNYAYSDDDNEMVKLLEASGYIPSEKEKNDPRFKTALTVDIKPNTMQKNAKKLGWKISRAGIPPLLRK